VEKYGKQRESTQGFVVIFDIGLDLQMTIFFAEQDSMVEILLPTCPAPEGVGLMNSLSNGVHSAALQFSQQHDVASRLGESCHRNHRPRTPAAHRNRIRALPLLNPSKTFRCAMLEITVIC
jgi:hypothetical protein